jgi:hypothetical protein
LSPNLALALAMKTSRLIGLPIDKGR